MLRCAARVLTSLSRNMNDVDDYRMLNHIPAEQAGTCTAMIKRPRELSEKIGVSLLRNHCPDENKWIQFTGLCIVDKALG